MSTDKQLNELTELTTPAAGDLIYVVDVSDTSEDAAGSSRKIQASNLGTVWAQTSAESSAGVTPTDLRYEPGDVRRYGATGDGVTDDTTAVNNAAISNDVVYIPYGLTFLVTAFTFTGNPSFVGHGTLKKSGTSTLFTYSNGMTDVLFDGITIDTNSTGAWIWDNNSSGITNLTIKNCKVSNITDGIWNIFGAEPCININIDSNSFLVASGTSRVQSGGIRSVYGYRFVNNYSHKIDHPSITNTAGLDDTTYPEPGQIVISNNVFRGLPPDLTTLDPSDEISVILIRSSTFENKDIIVSDNIIAGGKVGINIAGETSGTTTNVSITGNVVRDYRNTGIGVSRAGNTINHVVIANNTISVDDGNMTGAVADRYGIQAANGDYIIQGNHIENMTKAGIQIEEAGEVLIHGNYVDNTVNAGSSELGGIYVAKGSNISIVGNVVKDTGYSGSTLTAGIKLNNTASQEVLISDNRILDATPYQAYNIALSDTGGAPHPSNVTVCNNHLGAQTNAGAKIYIRSATYNVQRIFNNYGWGEASTTWDPGTVNAGATATTTVTVNGALGTDEVEVYFFGIFDDAGIGAPGDWIVKGHVTSANTVTVYLTNTGAAADTFTGGAAQLKVKVRRFNY